MDKNNTTQNQEYVSLKEYINNTLTALEKSIDTRFESVGATTASALAAADKATTKAESANEKRFDSVNEFRASLADQQRNLIPRSEVELLVKGINDKIDSLNDTTISRQGKQTGQKEGMAVVALVAGIVSILVVLLSRFIK